VDVAAWLRDLGLARYEEAFRDNDIDAEVLGELTDTDLEKLGISLGHRKKLLRAIAALQAPPEIEQGAGPSATAKPQTHVAERRQLTVLFCDLVGSTELSAALDPEDMSELIRAYQNTVAGEMARFEGHIAKFMGDGMLAYFGYPRAHEDEAERAVRAGLAVVKAVGGLPTAGAVPLAARVGIATGLVMVGELIGEGAAQEQTVVGETPNIAARLQALAAPGSVVISQATRRLVGGLFELADLGRGASKAFPSHCRPGASKGRVVPKVASRRCTASGSHPWSGASTSSASCSSAGLGPRTATAR
jgi:class 3 adenylate cyclase